MDSFSLKRNHEQEMVLFANLDWSVTSIEEVVDCYDVNFDLTSKAIHYLVPQILRFIIENAHGGAVNLLLVLEHHLFESERNTSNLELFSQKERDVILNAFSYLYSEKLGSPKDDFITRLSDEFQKTPAL